MVEEGLLYAARAKQNMTTAPCVSWAPGQPAYTNICSSSSHIKKRVCGSIHILLIIDFPQSGIFLCPAAGISIIIAEDDCGHTAMLVMNTEFIHICYLSFLDAYELEADKVIFFVSHTCKLFLAGTAAAVNIDCFVGVLVDDVVVNESHIFYLSFFLYCSIYFPFCQGVAQISLSTPRIFSTL